MPTFNDVWSKAIRNPEMLEILTDIKNGKERLKKIDLNSDQWGSFDYEKCLKIFEDNNSDDPTRL